MKFSKAEKIWLAAVVIFYVLYNLPFFPAYLDPEGTLIHAALTLIPLWIAVYIGLFKVSKSYGSHPADTDHQLKEEDPAC